MVMDFVKIHDIDICDASPSALAVASKSPPSLLLTTTTTTTVLPLPTACSHSWLPPIPTPCSSMLPRSPSLPVTTMMMAGLMPCKALILWHVARTPGCAVPCLATSHWATCLDCMVSRRRHHGTGLLWILCVSECFSSVICTYMLIILQIWLSNTVYNWLASPLRLCYRFSLQVSAFYRIHAYIIYMCAYFMVLTFQHSPWMINVSPNGQADEGADYWLKPSRQWDISWETVDLYGTSMLYPSLSASLLTMHSLLLYCPLRLNSHTPGISSCPYDNVPRTTCGRNETLTRCRGEGHDAGESMPVLYYRYKHQFFDW